MSPTSDPSRSFSCACGATQWQLTRAHKARHIVCYCKDCQTAATHLAVAADYLDNGGTHVMQALPADFTITKGADHFALMRLSPKGMFRWFAACCGTPMANTTTTPKFSFVSVPVRKSELDGRKPIAAVNTEAAKTPVKQHGMMRVVSGILGGAFTARLDGSYRNTPFFNDDGSPVRTPKVLTKDERKASTP